MKVRSNGYSNTTKGNSGGSLKGSRNVRYGVLVIPIVLSNDIAQRTGLLVIIL